MIRTTAVCLTSRRVIINSLSLSILFSLLALSTTISIINLNVADCLLNTNGSSPTDRVFVVKSAANNQETYKNVQESFKQVFDKLTIQVKENTPIGTKLADIQADDQDSQNAKIIYAIVGGFDQQSFTLRVDSNINKVELVNEVNFDYESSKKNYHVVIRATSLFLRYEVEIDIIVTDENDNKPQLEDFSIVFNNYKNNFPTTYIGRVPAYDADQNDQLHYRIEAGNKAELIYINENTGEIQLSPMLNSNVPSKAIILIAVSDGLNEVHAQLSLTVNLVTEAMLQNSVVLRLDGIGRTDFLTKKFDVFQETLAKILFTDGTYVKSYIVIFNVEESLQELPQHDLLNYRLYHGSSIINSTLSVNVSFSARANGHDSESYIPSQTIEERIYLKRNQLMQALSDSPPRVYVAPFQDDLCAQEPCQNFQECHPTYKFYAAKPFNQTRSIIFRPIEAVQSFTCTCPPAFTGINQKTECNLQINQCFSNPCLNGGICHRHELGFTCECKPEFLGHRCEQSFANSTCQSVSTSQSPSTQDRQVATMCSGRSTCVNVNRSHYSATKSSGSSTNFGGFSCQGCSYAQWSTELCQLKTRSFKKGAYITLPSLRKRHRFHIMLQFATLQNDALILYNGRYNDKHDFIALEIVDSYLKFSYSLGSTVTTVSLSSIPVSNGQWHKVAIDYKNRNVTLLIDDCDPVIDDALARIQVTNTKRCSNTSLADANVSLEFRALDLTSPMQLGSLVSIPTDSQISANGFVGCMSDLYIDHELVDFFIPIYESGTQIGCPEKRSFCQQNSCNGHPCQDIWGAAKCSCGEDYLGKTCEILISNEKVRRFSGNSYLTFSPIESTISQNWQISMHFRTINPNGILMRASLDPESNILLEVFNGGLRLSYRSHNITFNKINVDNGEWHFVELFWSNDFTLLQVDYNRNLSVQSSEMGVISGSVIKTITIGASPTRSNAEIQPESSADFTSSVANVPIEDFSNLYPMTSNISQSFVGCIYGFNISDNLELWLSPTDERNVDRGCQVADVCETQACPPNSRCVKKGMNYRKCVCNPGHVGERCLPVCDLNPCQGENSRCTPLTNSIGDASANSDQTSDITLTSSAKYLCECETLKSGKNCEHQLSPGCPPNWWGKPSAESNSTMCGPCNCDESKGFDGKCHQTTGQCFCKPNYYQPTGSDYCLPCDCYIVGSQRNSCNQTTGQCKCRPGVVGRRCDTCANSYAEVTQRGCEVIYDACPKTFSDNIWWDKTPLDKMASQQCPPSTSTGTATRFCHKTESWQKPSMFDCISNTFMDLYSQYKLFEENTFPLTAYLAMKVARNLRNALNETTSDPSMQLYGSDMYISFRLLHHLIMHESRQSGLNLTHRQDVMYIRNIVESISYILDPAYAENWPEISNRSPNGGAEHLLKLMDLYGKVLIESQSELFVKPFEVSTKHLTFGMDILSTDQLWDLSKSTSLSGQSYSPPYATEPFGLHVTTSSEQTSWPQGHFHSDGSSIYLDYSMSRDSSPAITIPKHDNYPADPSNSDETTKVLIPLKTLRIKTPQELLPQTYYQAKSRAKREELVIPDLKYMRQKPAFVAYSIFKSLGPLLPGFYDNTVQHRLGMVASANSPVVWLTVRPVNSTDFLSKNIYPKINYVLKMVEPTGKTRPQCAIWDFTPQTSQTASSKDQSTYGLRPTGKFSTKGCEIKGIRPNHKLKFKYEYVNCSCDHFGAVTVLMDSANYDYIKDDDSNYKDNTVTIALGISIFVLASALFVLSCVRGHSIKSNSNSINKNLLFILIVIELLILYTVLSRNSLNQREYHCKLVAIFLHYFSISLFFWLLVNAIHFYRMLTELRDINHGPMKFYHVVGYAIPAFFVSVAVGLRIEQFGNYLFCWLSIHEPIIWSMFGPVSVASSIIIILFSLAFCKSLPVKEDLNGADLLKNHMLINLIKTPLIGVYWIITVYMVNETLSDHTFLFAGITVVKSVVLLILLCVVDKYIRYNIYVSWLRFKGEEVPFSDDTMNYSTDRWMPTMIEQGAPDKLYPYGGYSGQVTTPGFQSPYNDIFKPDVLAFSAASTTSRSTATGTSSGDVYRHQHRIKGLDKEDGGYGRSGRRHRRRHKKSHHRHHHHKHHHHHHHQHRSHRHHTDDHHHYDRRRFEEEQSLHDDNSHENLASSHSSDEDDVSTLPKKTYQSNIIAKEDARETEKEQQTVPMELPSQQTSSTSAATNSESPKPANI